MGRPKKRRQWGSGQVVRGTGGLWGIRWRENGARRRRHGFATREDAERVLAKINGDLAQGRAGLPPDARGLPTLGELVPDFLDRRELTHRAADCDRYRWDKHLEPHFAHLKPTAVDVARIRAFVELKLAEKLNPATIRIMVALLSSIFVDLVERGLAAANPARGLPDSVMRMMRSTHDSKKTPFIEQLADVRRIHLALPEPLHVAYAIGALAGLRTGEVFALRWRHVDLVKRRLHVRESVKGPLKDGDSRIVPILDSLLPILAGWKLEKNGAGDARVVPPLHQGLGTKVGKETPGVHLRAVLKKLQLEQTGLGWYEATRHTFASQWVMAGGSIEKLKELLGHYSVVMTERYAHLRPELFTAADLATIQVDLRAGAADVAGAIGPKTGQRAANAAGST
jgi:integrase